MTTCPPLAGCLPLNPTYLNEGKSHIEPLPNG